MFNLGLSELILLAVLALIFIGPKQLPEVARVIGRLLNEWKRATSELKNSITDWQPRPPQPPPPPLQSVQREESETKDQT